MEDLIIGTGLEAVKGKTVTIQAMGRLNKGDVFCDTKTFGMPWKIEAGRHKAIPALRSRWNARRREAAHPC